MRGSLFSGSSSPSPSMGLEARGWIASNPRGALNRSGRLEDHCGSGKAGSAWMHGMRVRIHPSRRGPCDRLGCLQRSWPDSWPWPLGSWLGCLGTFNHPAEGLEGVEALRSRSESWNFLPAVPKAILGRPPQTRHLGPGGGQWAGGRSSGQVTGGGAGGQWAGGGTGGQLAQPGRPQAGRLWGAVARTSQYVAVRL